MRYLHDFYLQHQEISLMSPLSNKICRNCKNKFLNRMLNFFTQGKPNPKNIISAPHYKILEKMMIFAKLFSDISSQIKVYKYLFFSNLCYFIALPLKKEFKIIFSEKLYTKTDKKNKNKKLNLRKNDTRTL